MGACPSQFVAGLQKEELGEALHEVDFQQLKIENAQFLEKIDERNQELLQLKLTVGNTLQILNYYKRKLHYATAMATYLVKDIAQRKESLEKIAREAIFVEEERLKAEILNKKLRRQLAEYRVPPVLNYVHEKMTVHDLENSLRIWERKVEIAEMALKSYRNVWHKAKMASHQLQALLPEQERHKVTEQEEAETPGKVGGKRWKQKRGDVSVATDKKRLKMHIARAHRPGSELCSTGYFSGRETTKPNKTDRLEAASKGLQNI
ncbi:coiled-coil domain-containing protein 113 [Notechis scutatus]|uniref:Cilia- and flagella-associated protein 263 n=1 Tax=Notechis scutatus TaxID=8663 RepID=A0A6J1VNU9_9SAUR|nr:coiled-coil domain-containing protein 113 [Notechis scutatus]